jgi:hypothetical protein
MRLLGSHDWRPCAADGVRCLALVSSMNLLITGGLDGLVCLWCLDFRKTPNRSKR